MTILPNAVGDKYTPRVIADQSPIRVLTIGAWSYFQSGKTQSRGVISVSFAEYKFAGKYLTPLALH